VRARAYYPSSYPSFGWPRLRSIAAELGPLRPARKLYYAMLVALRLVEVEAQLGAMASALLISSKSRTITAGTREKPTAMEAANR
jgi:hypothetical protein